MTDVEDAVAKLRAISADLVATMSRIALAAVAEAAARIATDGAVSLPGAAGPALPAPARKPKPVRPKAERAPLVPAAKPEPRRPAPRHDSAPPAAANGVTIDFAAGTMAYGGSSVTASAMQLEVAQLLARAMPDVMPRAEICKRVWGAADKHDVLYVTVSALKPKLAEIGLELKTIPKFGYALAPVNA